MPSVQLESLVDLRDKHAHRRYKRSIALAALAVGMLILGVTLLGGLSYHQQLPELLGLDPPGGLVARETSIALRPEFPVSTFLYERRSFRWFAGWALFALAGGLAVKALTTTCIAATAGTGAVPCVLAAVAAGALLAGLALPPGGGGSSGGVTPHDLEMGNMNEYYQMMTGTKRDEDEKSHIYQLLRGTLGDDYQYVGHINGSHEIHADLIARNGGKPVAVYSFTSAAGTRMHHSMIRDSASGNTFHRLGFNTMDNTAASKRDTAVESTQEHFSSGGIDVFACTASSEDHLVTADTSQMESELTCQYSDNTIESAQGIEVQVYDADTMETIGSGKIAPYGSSGKSGISGESATSGCPASLDQKSGCPMETA